MFSSEFQLLQLIVLVLDLLLGVLIMKLRCMTLVE